MANGPEFMRAMEFITNRASDQELLGLKIAIDQRLRGAGGASSLDFEAMSRDVMRQFQGKFGIGKDFHKMTREMVGRMIRVQQPDISDRDLAVLLDQWVPDPTKAKAADAGKEHEIPRDALLNMIRQFTSYSLGRLKDEEARELKAAMPDWTNRYWDVFSVITRSAIRELIRGSIDEKQFWEEIGRHLNQPPS